MAINQVSVAQMRRAGGGSRKKQTTTIHIKRDAVVEAQNMDLLRACYNDWMQLAERRAEHRRFMRYYSGDQWGDLVEDPDNRGQQITERQLISRTGVTPITHNILQEYIRNVCGQMLTNTYKTIINARREEDSQAAEMITNAIQACLDANENQTLDINTIIALHTMGVAWCKITYTAWDERNVTDARVDYVNEMRIAWNQDCEDPRLFDIRRICELHSYTRSEIIGNFAKNAYDEQRLNAILNEIEIADRERFEQNNNKASDVLESMDFWGSANEINKYRIIEVWSKRSRWVLWTNDRATFDRPKEYVDDINAIEAEVAAENARRIMQGVAAGMDEDTIPLIETERHYEHYWYCQFLTPQGVALLEMESPYEHQQHPYVFAAMPVIDGVSKPLFSDLIEMQRNINRQRTMLDMLIASSAKNTLFVPEEALEGRSIEEYADEIMKINGVIKFKAKPGYPMPEFLQRNAINLGVFDVLNFDMQQIQAISGLSGAMQGQVAKAGTPSSLYAQQAQNTMLNFVLLFDRFNNYCKKRDAKLVRVILQYYTVPRYLSVSGRSYGQTATEYIPEKAQAIAENYSLVPSQGMDTPVFRERINEYLMDMLKGGLIPLDMFLQHTTLPFGKQLLSELQALQQQQQGGQGFNPETVNNVRQMASAAAGQDRPADAEPRAQQMIAQLLGNNYQPSRLPVQQA